jgi:amidase
MPPTAHPAGTDGNGVPSGIQVMARCWHHEQLLAAAEAIAAVTGGFRAPPGL